MGVFQEVKFYYGKNKIDSISRNGKVVFSLRKRDYDTGEEFNSKKFHLKLPADLLEDIFDVLSAKIDLSEGDLFQLVKGINFCKRPDVLVSAEVQAKPAVYSDYVPAEIDEDGNIIKEEIPAKVIEPSVAYQEAVYKEDGYDIVANCEIENAGGEKNIESIVITEDEYSSIWQTIYTELNRIFFDKDCFSSDL